MDSQTDDFKTKRQNYSINIRRAAREQIINKRRTKIQSDQSSMNQSGNEELQDLNHNIVDLRNINDIRILHAGQYSIGDYDTYVQMLGSSDYFTRLKGIIAIRTITECQNSEVVKLFLQKNIIPKLIFFLNPKQQPQIMLQSIWLLANLSFCNQGICAKFIESGIAEPIIRFLRENQPYFIDNALVALGNISAENSKFRDAFLKIGALQAIYQCLKNYRKSITYQNAIWALTNLCRGTPPPSYNLISSALNVLCRALKSPQLSNTNRSSTNKILADILWTISTFTQISKANIDRVAQQNIIQILFRFSIQEKGLLYFPAARIMGNFILAGEAQTQILMKYNLFDTLMQLLRHPKKNIRRQVCWMLSNVAAGTSNHVRMLLQRKDIFDRLIHMFQVQDEDTRVQIAYIYPNLAYLGPKKQLISLYIQYDIMPHYINLLNCKSTELLISVLKTLSKLLRIGNQALVQGNNIMLQKFIENQGTNKLQDLQDHQSNKVYQLSVGILKKYFDVDDA